jgi:hypothetical protein
MSNGAGVPAITSAQAVGRAVRAADRLPAFGRLLAEVPAEAS